VLSAQGKAFCAGANFGDPARQAQEAREAEKTAKGDPADSLGPINHLYVQAVRIFRNKKPIVAAVHGAAIGGGLGLAVSADFRVTCPEARISISRSNSSSASAIWLISDMSKKFSGGRRISMVPT
jgi:enoyl-CoA hydratase/carnithine racemase